MVAFENEVPSNEVPSIQRMNVSFFTILRSLSTLYSVDNTNFLIDFLCWLGSR